DGAAARRARWLAQPAAAAGLSPFAAQRLVLRRLGFRFSFAEYVRGPRLPPVRVERDVALEARSPPLRADVFHAAGRGPHPFVVTVHGGSWKGGERGQGAHVSRALAAAGYTVFDVEYGLAPEHPFPEGIGDVKCLLGRLRERAEEFDLDPRRAVLLGRSAGGQMALVAAYSCGDARVPPTGGARDAPVLGVIALYPPVDLVYGYANPMRPDVQRGNEALELYLGGPPARRLEAYHLASPRSWVGPGLPPTLLLHGESDRMVEPLHSVLLDAELRAAGQRVETARVPFGEHAFEMRPGSVGDQLARAAILAFLASL
ncbi:MAG TPA: alpha/beta hydrolase, partial [Vicinamibacteria bacterium]|nr:alpha/beta hydrolase [Vicinamibacteria bacterium]